MEVGSIRDPVCEVGDLVEFLNCSPINCLLKENPNFFNEECNLTLNTFDSHQILPNPSKMDHDDAIQLLAPKIFNRTNQNTPIHNSKFRYK
jgi:hypothetical protein